MDGMSRLGLLGLGGCILGVMMTIATSAFVGRYPLVNGSNFNVPEIYLFLALFFGGVVVALMGLGILIYLAVYRRQRAKP